MKFIVHKKNGEVEVLLLPHKGTTKFSFVNLTKGHICSCVFDSIQDAINDMDSRMKMGLLDRYEIV